MFTVSDIIHLIQFYYYKATSTSYDTVASDVEFFRLESLRGAYTASMLVQSSLRLDKQTLRKSWV